MSQHIPSSHSFQRWCEQAQNLLFLGHSWHWEASCWVSSPCGEHLLNEHTSAPEAIGTKSTALTQTSLEWGSYSSHIQSWPYLSELLEPKNSNPGKSNNNHTLQAYAHHAFILSFYTTMPSRNSKWAPAVQKRSGPNTFCQKLETAGIPDNASQSKAGLTG